MRSSEANNSKGNAKMIFANVFAAFFITSNIWYSPSMPYSNWLKYGYKLGPNACGEMEIKKSRLDHKLCDGICRESNDEDIFGPGNSWDHIGQEACEDCKGINKGDVYVVQGVYESDMGESYSRECCIPCAIFHGAIQRTR